MLKAVPPLEMLTAQELIYCAAGLRVMAVQCEKDAETRRNPTQREIPLSEAKVYREIAAKCERMARR